MLELTVIASNPLHLDDYASIPIRFEVNGRVRLNELARSKGRSVASDSIAPYLKDYDLIESEHPATLAHQYDTSNWGVFSALVDGNRIGAAIVAQKTPDFEMLQGRNDLAVLVDIRIDPTYQGRGVGRKLFHAIAEWATDQGCTQLIVETQDINVGACRFYSAMGLTIQSIDPDGYGPGISEAKLIWQVDLSASACNVQRS